MSSVILGCSNGIQLLVPINVLDQISLTATKYSYTCYNSILFGAVSSHFPRMNHTMDTKKQLFNYI